VIVVNFNASQLLRDHLATAEFPAGTVITVVENSIERDEKEVVRTLAKANEWTLLDSGGNVGFGKAMNLGAADALAKGCTTLLLLNPDAWIDSNELDRLLENHDRYPSAMISPRIFREDGSLWFSGAQIRSVVGRASHMAGRESDSDWISAACLLVPGTAWQRLDGMDEEYFLYWEDVDLTFRWKQLGGRLLVAEDARATHSVGGTQLTSIGKSTTFLRYNSRNRLLFASKNLGFQRTVLWAITTPNYWVHMLRQARIRKSKDKLGAISAIIQGTLSGLATAFHDSTGQRSAPSASSSSGRK
jgi:GT2 family glycosyltransferase